MENVTGLVKFHRGERSRSQLLTGTRIVLRCVRCGTLNERVWSDVTGQQLTSQYRYPDGYKPNFLPPQGVSIREAMRVEYLKRMKSRGIEV